MAKFLRTLQGKLSLALLLSFIALAAIAALLFVRFLQGYQREVAQTLHRDLAQVVVDQYLDMHKDSLDLAAASELFHQLMILGPNLEFYLLDVDGKILAYSTEPSNIKRERVALKPLHQFIAGKDRSHLLLADDPKNTAREKVFSAAPIYKNNQPLGYLYVILNGVEYEGIAELILSSKMLRLGLWLMALVLAASLLATLWLTKWLTRPLKHLTAQVAAIQQQGFDADIEEPLQQLQHTWPEPARDDIQHLAQAFTTLLTKLKSQHREVLHMDQSRRELLAHISHDLRSPLASLQGYLETCELHEERLTRAELTQYIGVARGNAARLGKLIEQLFELAQLESERVPVQFEPLGIAELVQDVLQKFALQAEQAGVSLAVDPKDQSLLVQADVEKLERVFTNLVDNALRHTQAGGAIAVRLQGLPDHVQVTVSDTGVGIPSDELEQVFEPHFKAGNTVRGNCAHGGLGLTITKKLLALHDSDIRVRSAPGQGASFEFQLSRV